MLQLTLRSHSPADTVLTVAGWLEGENVVHLENEMNRWRSVRGQLTLDLADVKAIDDKACALLRKWSAAGLVLRTDSVYWRARLAAEGLTAEGLTAT